MKINIREVFERMDDVEEKDNEIKDNEIAEPEETPEEASEPAACTEADSEAEEHQKLDEASREEPEEKPESVKEGLSIKERLRPQLTKIKPLWKLYGELCIIALAFIGILAFMFIYTTMIPREVSLTVDGKTRSVVTKDNTVAKLLESEGIEYCERDYLSVPATGFISDGMKLNLRHATEVRIIADGKSYKFKSLKKTVSGVLADAGIKVGEIDIVTPAADSKITPKMTITVQRVKIKKETVKEKVPFAVVNQDDTSMNQGETKVVTEGVNGKHKVIYEITYIDGKEASRQELSREVIEPVVDKVVANGTRVVFNGKSYSRKLVVKAYSYTGGGRTAMGTQARVGEIAVDPRVIPLGSNVYIEGVGYRRAEDTGGNIKGNTIDIYMNTQSECIRWGVRYVTIYIE